MTLFPEKPILIVDDEENSLKSLQTALKTGGINNILLCNSSKDVMNILKENDISIVLLDIVMPDITGEQLLPVIKREYPAIAVIMITGINELNTAVSSMKNGAYDYFTKPVEKEKLLSSVKVILELMNSESEYEKLKKHFISDTLENPEDFIPIITSNNKMWNIFKYIEAISNTSHPVLIIGETGVGKELIAKAIHTSSKRKGKFISINIAGIDDSMFSDTLFGHKKGSYTGADSARPGVVEEAKDGTLFLDEIGDLAPVSQVKLLRLIQEKEYLPIGYDVPKISNTRIIVATNCDLLKLQEEGKFRKDLYYRLKTHFIEIPPLRNRKEDIPILVDHFIEKAKKELNKMIKNPSPELITYLKDYHYPGNVRELESMIFNAASECQKNELSIELFKEISKTANSEKLKINPDESFVFGKILPTLKQIENALIVEALKRSDNNQSKAAKILGITRQALHSRLKGTI